MLWWVLPLLFLLVLLALILAFFYGRIQGRRSLKAEEIPQDFLQIYQEIQRLPSRVLAAIQGSINPQKGKVAELLTYAELRYDYDILIPLGQPIDFIGIKRGAQIDFIEVKSGHAVLSDEQKEIQGLVQQGRVHFRTIQVRDDETRRLVEGGGAILL